MPSMNISFSLSSCLHNKVALVRRNYLWLACRCNCRYKTLVSISYVFSKIVFVTISDTDSRKSLEHIFFKGKKYLETVCTMIWYIVKQIVFTLVIFLVNNCWVTVNSCPHGACVLLQTFSKVLSPAEYDNANFH